MSTRRKYVIVGTGARSVTYFDAIVDTHRENAELVAICDLSPTRMAWQNRRLAKQFGTTPVPMYPALDFDRMIRERKPDAVIVCTMDSTHDQYIMRAMDLGCDVIVEKPMTTDEPKANAILEAIRRTGRTLRVTHNCRYLPWAGKIRELVMKGTIGRPQAVDLSWTMDTSHGADYFRRWHSQKECSGGLWIHKATHHYDLVNWWIASYPRTVFAMADLKFYGQGNAEARGEHYSYDRYHGHPEAKDDPFALFMEDDEGARGLYLDAEKDSGYIRDRNVFRDGITIEDTMAVMVRYRSNVVLNYSLIAYSPWEGLRVAITGDRGRLEYYQRSGSHIITGQTSDKIALEMARGSERSLRVFPMFGLPYDVEIPVAEGGHDGCDPLMHADIFAPTPQPDPLGRATSHLDGTAAMLIGASANTSIRTGLPVTCDDLVRLPDARP